MKLLDKLYAYLWPGLSDEDMARYGNNCNTYVIAGAFANKKGKAHIVIDPGHIINDMGVPCLERLGQKMRRDGLKVEEVGLVINTHSHRDHTEASQAFQDRHGAVVALGELEADYYEAVGRSRYQARGGIRVPDLRPDIKIKEGPWKLEGFTLEVLLAPGHTPGHICLYWAEAGRSLWAMSSFTRIRAGLTCPGGVAPSCGRALSVWRSWMWSIC